MTYDSRPETVKHISEVQTNIQQIIADLRARASDHDKSKLKEPEKSRFDKWTPILADHEFGSPGYEEGRKGLGEALDHHYANNDHHPEHFSGGVESMNYFQLLEMLADWKAASGRHANPDFAKSMAYCIVERFKIGHVIEQQLVRTAVYLGWMDEGDYLLHKSNSLKASSERLAESGAGA